MRRLPPDLSLRPRALAGLAVAVLGLALAGCAPLSAPEEPRGLDLLTRAEWGASAPVLEPREHRITHITIHHTATPQAPGRTLADKLRGLQRFSQSPGKLASGKDKPAWADVPYHYYVDVSGQVGEAREWRYAGDTNTTYDPTGHLLIVVEGNFETEQLTPAQMQALHRMTGWAAERWDVPADRIAAHRDFAQTACPGHNLYARIPELRAAAAGRE